MTAAEQKSEIDRRTVDGYGYINMDGLRVRVKVIDTRKAYGRDDAKITPADGNGERWVDLTKIEKE